MSATITDRYLTHRGSIRALTASGTRLRFVTEHDEGRPTALYRVDTDSFTLSVDPLPAGARALFDLPGTGTDSDGPAVAVGAVDGQVLVIEKPGAKPRPIGQRSEAIAALVVAGDHVVAAAGNQLIVLDPKAKSTKGSSHPPDPVQELELPGRARCLAADPTGRWLACGTDQGAVAVFEAEAQSEFVSSNVATLHEGAVTALAFEPDELRFFSAGADRRLLSTLARGRLEPEDRGKSYSHEREITAILFGPGARFLTGGRDKAVKSWPRQGGARPAALKEDLVGVVALAIVEVQGRARLAVAGTDGSIRLVGLDAEGKLGAVTHRIYGFLPRARQELSQGTASRREAAVDELAEADDRASLEILAKQAAQDTDPTIRQRAAEAVAASDHRRAPELLSDLLKRPDAPVRRAAFEGLRRQLGPEDFRPIDQALATGHIDIGILAVEGLAERAAQDDRAAQRIEDALSAPAFEVGRAALNTLEGLGPGDSPEADLKGLASERPAVRRLALRRLHQRRLLDHPTVGPSVRRRFEDDDAEVRAGAILTAILSQPALAEALRALDEDLDRALGDWTDPKAAHPARDNDKSRDPSSSPAKRRPKSQSAVAKLIAAVGPVERAPLVSAASARRTDVSLSGARGLAQLGDPHALGLLLQLSREPIAETRMAACQGLATLGDPRGLDRVAGLLFDDDLAVRDAACSALLALHHKSPLTAAEVGLGASHVDVRQRALQVLIREARQRPKDAFDEPIGPLLTRVLDDPAPAIRSEAFKAALNLRIDAPAEALRFVVRSAQADVRLDALTEITAQIKEPWALDLLLSFYNDPDPTLRAEAFAFATTQTKTKGLEFFEAGLRSHYADVRLLAVRGLIAKRTVPAQKLLAEAVDDDDREVRTAALNALISKGHAETLIRTLRSPHPDVQVRAASALARQGNTESLQLLMDLVQTSEPEEIDQKAAWRERVLEALNGLASLGDPRATTPIRLLIDHQDSALAQRAAAVLVWVAGPDDLDVFDEPSRHADPAIRIQAALGRACRGDRSAVATIETPEARRTLGDLDMLSAVVAIGTEGEDRLIGLLDGDDTWQRERALIILLLREWVAPDPAGQPGRCLAAMASSHPRVRLLAAEALEALPEPEALRDQIVRLLNGERDPDKMAIAPEILLAFARLLTFGNPLLRGRTARLFDHLDPSVETSASFRMRWNVFRSQFDDRIENVLGRVTDPDAESPSRPDASTVRDLAFGAYAGLIREFSGTSKESSAIRLTALDRLLSLSKLDDSYATPARSVFLQMLGDPIQEVRSRAFGHAHAIGMDRTTLGAEALAADHLDIGAEGLRLLSEAGDDQGATTEAGRAVLREVMLTRRDDLAIEAAKQLGTQGVPIIEVARDALDGASESLRRHALVQLADLRDPPEAARAVEALHAALTSRHREVRRRAARILAERRDPKVFDPLLAQLADAPEQRDRLHVLDDLESLDDPRTPSALMDWLERAGKNPDVADRVLAMIGEARDPALVDLLLSYARRAKKTRPHAFQAVLTVSGHDQYNEDPEDERPHDRRWLERQQPRHDDVLARLLQSALDLEDLRLLRSLIPIACWSLSDAVDSVLGRMATHPEEPVRHEVVAAISWRVRRRSSDPESLVRALGHGDPRTQFLAAEGLARGRRAEGITVLLSSLDFLQDLQARQRAVTALGELADPRALDTLLPMANDLDHALNVQAIEAIGHFATYDPERAIFRLLTRNAAKPGWSEMQRREAAWRGLRWYGDAESWRWLREAALDPQFLDDDVSSLFEQLAHDDDPDTRAVVLRVLRETKDPSVMSAALEAARVLFDDDSLEPDLAFVRNPLATHCFDDFNDDTLDQSVARLAERGSSRDLFAILNDACGSDPSSSDPFEISDIDESGSAIGPLHNALLRRDPAPLDDARNALVEPGSSPLVLGLSARILGRHDAAIDRDGFLEAFDRVRSDWETVRSDVRRQQRRTSGDSETDLLPWTNALSTLCWAAGRLGLASDRLLALASDEAYDDEAVRAVRRAAMTTLIEFAANHPDHEAVPAIRALLADAMIKADSDSRLLAVTGWSRLAFDSEQAGSPEPPIDRVQSDPLVLNRLLNGTSSSHDRRDVLDALGSAASEVQAQGAVIPQLIAHGDLEALSRVAQDRSQAEEVRLGAIEGLGRLAVEASEAVLVAIGSDKADDEDLRRAAWRARRRSRRLRDSNHLRQAGTDRVTKSPPMLAALTFEESRQ